MFKFENIEVEADAVFGTVQESTSIFIGNIPHKADYRAWATENMYEMREEIKVSYVLYLAYPTSSIYKLLGNLSRHPKL